MLSSRNSGDNPTSSRNSSGKSNGLRRSTASESGGKTHRSEFVIFGSSPILAQCSISIPPENSGCIEIEHWARMG